MQYCTRCGRPRDEGAGFCVVCGSQFPDAPVTPRSEPVTPAEATNPTGPIPVIPPPGFQGPPGFQDPPGFQGPPPQGPPPQGPPMYGPPPQGPPPAWGPGPRDESTLPPYGLDALMGSGQPAETLAGPGGPAGPGGNGRPPRRSGWLLLTIMIIVVLAGGGTAAAFVLSSNHSAKPQASQTTSPPPARPPPTPTQSPSTSPSPTSSPGQGQVAEAASVAGNPQTPRIGALLDSYFSAINTRNYPAYYALLSPQERQLTSQSQFSKGFATTKDRKETLQALSAGPGGTTVASVTFTSHQNPANSVDGHQSCTHWHISLYLEQSGNSYVIGKPPSSYHAGYAAC